MEYSSAVQRHFAAPRRARELERGVPGLVAGEAEDRTLHVWVRFQLQIVEDVVAAAAFQVFGCPHTIAAASKLDVKALCAALEVPIEKLGKLLRIEDAVAACLAPRRSEEG